MSELVATIWDVGHGISIWLQMPNGTNHWIDLGATDEFSPSKHVHKNYGVKKIDYLIISHPDKDHLEDLPSFEENFGDPRVLRRNKTVPKKDSYGTESFEYQKQYKILDEKLTSKVQWESNPRNPNINGGADYYVNELDYGKNTDGKLIETNNTSVITMIHYNGVLFVFPGDIEPLGWNTLWKKDNSSIQTFINKGNSFRLLVAPHHGRTSGYCEEMMNTINPHLVIISDVWGESETHNDFRTKPLGYKMED